MSPPPCHPPYLHSQPLQPRRPSTSFLATGESFAGTRRPNLTPFSSSNRHLLPKPRCHARVEQQPSTYCIPRTCGHTYPIPPTTRGCRLLFIPTILTGYHPPNSGPNIVLDCPSTQPRICEEQRTASWFSMMMWSVRRAMLPTAARVMGPSRAIVHHAVPLSSSPLLATTAPQLKTTREFQRLAAIVRSLRPKLQTGFGGACRLRHWDSISTVLSLSLPFPMAATSTVYDESDLAHRMSPRCY